MLGIEHLGLFVAAGLALNVTPGPDMLYVATRSAAQGRLSGVVSALAISSGGIAHTAAAALGFSALLGYSALAFQIVKWAGALYLVYLGVRTLMGSGRALGRHTGNGRALFRIYAQGVMVSVLNPKVALFFLAFLPQFANPASPLFPWQIACLGLTFCTTGTMVNTAVALGTGGAARWMKDRRTGRVGAWISGGVFIALGLGLAASEGR